MHINGFHDQHQTLRLNKLQLTLLIIIGYLVRSVYLICTITSNYYKHNMIYLDENFAFVYNKFAPKTFVNVFTFFALYTHLILALQKLDNN